MCACDVFHFSRLSTSFFLPPASFFQIADAAWTRDAPVRDAALVSALRGLAAGVVCGAGGTVQGLLDAHAGDTPTVRARLDPPLAFLASALAAPRGPARSAVTRPLGGGEGPPACAHLPGTGVGRAAFAAAAAAGSGLLGDFGGTATTPRLLTGVSIFWAPPPHSAEQPLLLWTSEAGEDVGPLSSIAAALLEGARRRRGGWVGASGAPPSPGLAAAAALLGAGGGGRRHRTGGDVSSSAPAASPTTCPAFDAAAWRPCGGPTGEWWGVVGGEAAATTAAPLRLALSAGARRACLIASFLGRTVLLLALPPEVGAIPPALGSAAADAAAGADAAARSDPALSAPPGGAVGHVPGARYAWIDAGAGVVRSSPSSKAGTLSAEDRALAAAALDGLGMDEAGGGGRGDGADAACLVRSAAPGRPAWAAATRTAGRTLAVILPRGVPGDGLGGAAEGVRAFWRAWFASEGGGDVI